MLVVVVVVVVVVVGTWTFIIQKIVYSSDYYNSSYVCNIPTYLKGS